MPMKQQKKHTTIHTPFIVLLTALNLAACQVAPAGTAPALIPLPPCILVLFDPTEDGPVTIERAAEVARITAEAAADRPGTHLTFAVVGATVLESRTIYTTVSTAPKVGGKRALQLHNQRFIKQTVDSVVAIMQGILAARPRSTPLAASLAKLARSRDCNCQCILWVISDLLEYVDGPGPGRMDLECSQHLPSQKAWDAYLEHSGALLPGQLEGIERVTFAYVDLGPRGSNRCPAVFSLKRQSELESLFVKAALKAGAKSAEVRSGPPSFTNYTTTQKGDK